MGLAALTALTGCGLSGGGTSGASKVADTDQRIVVDNFRAPVANWALEATPRTSCPSPVASKP